MKTRACRSAKQLLRTALAGFSCLAILLLAGALTSAQTPALKDVFKGSFLVGAALNPAEFTGQDARTAALIKAQFNTITPENVLKWERVHPQPGSYSFELPDRYVAFGEKNHIFIVGHVLLWHNQTPAWVFQDDKGNPADRETLLKRLHDHIQTVVGRYKGRINGWDVVNEALEEDGTLRQTPWLKIIGEDYLVKAFQFAHEADPQAELYYNDYNIENEAKLKGALELLRKLQAQGVPVTGVGIQGHWHMDMPSNEQVDAAITAFGKLGLKVMITEFDVDVLPLAFQYMGADVTLSAELQPKLNPYPKALPDAVQQALAKRYAGLFTVFLKQRGVLNRVTFWGVTDGDSWLNNWPVKGRTNYPLLFDRSGQPKPAFDAVIRTASPTTPQ
jgi:endo-1,4-beta-xylanase